MTVKELITILEKMPKNATVELEILVSANDIVGSANAEPDEVFENTRNNVVIQGFQW